MSVTDISNTSSAHCLVLLASVRGLSDVSNVSIELVEAGVWNNLIYEAKTLNGNYYFKEYQEFVEIPRYSPPNISPEQRASVAQIAQDLGSDSFKGKYSLVPAIVARDSTAFVMEEVPSANHLLSYLSKGEYPKSIVETLPVALARFHNHTHLKDYSKTALADTQFKDYKLDLQYYKIAELLESTQKDSLITFVENYKQQNLCVVHGDLNSKNILITPNNAAYVIDFEQAHLGSPAYDLAFILSELYIASIQFKDKAEFRDLCTLFAKRYLNTLEGFDRQQIAQETTLHLAAQVLYRFQGPSHAVWTSYVDSKARGEIISRVSNFITPDPVSILEIF